MKRLPIILLVLALAAGLGCQSTPDEQPSDDPSYAAATNQTDLYPDEGPPLRECPDYDSQRGEICRLTPVDDAEVRIRVRFPETTTVESTEPIPSELIRFRFLGRQEDFVACMIPAARQRWTGQVDTSIKATLTGATFEHVTVAPMGLPDDVTRCFGELTRRLRVKRPPGGSDARITQPVSVSVRPVQ